MKSPNHVACQSPNQSLAIKIQIMIERTLHTITFKIICVLSLDNKLKLLMLQITLLPYQMVSYYFQVVLPISSVKQATIFNSLSATNAALY
jgi:hypothetical protein